MRFNFPARRTQMSIAIGRLVMPALSGGTSQLDVRLGGQTTNYCPPQKPRTSWVGTPTRTAGSRSARTRRRSSAASAAAPHGITKCTLDGVVFVKVTGLG